MKIISLCCKGDRITKLFFPTFQNELKLCFVMFTVAPNDVFEIIRHSNVFHTHGTWDKGGRRYGI